MQSDYFQSYECLEVHRLMLEDEPRTNSYREAIVNSGLFKDKVVMDVGAGTGILSLFCAKAGAKKVYSVEASALANYLSEIFEANNFTSETIQVVHGKVEEIDLGDLKVDIIVSEWMGFYLLHESMLDSVLFARDKYLKEDGLMFPNRASIYAAPCSIPSLWKSRRLYWTQPKYEFDMSPLLQLAFKQTKPEVDLIPTEGLLSDPQLLWNFDLQSIKSEELQTLTDRRFFSIEKDGQVHGVGLWFTVAFPSPDSAENEDFEPIELSTAPWDEETHWKQTVVLLPSEGNVEDGDILGWELKLDKGSSASRSYSIELNILDDDEPHPIPCDCGTAKCEIIRHFLTNKDKNEGENEDITDASTLPVSVANGT